MIIFYGVQQGSLLSIPRNGSGCVKTWPKHPQENSSNHGKQVVGVSRALEAIIGFEFWRQKSKQQQKRKRKQTPRARV